MKSEQVRQLVMLGVEDNEANRMLIHVQLPGQDGLALTRQLKVDPDRAAIPVVAITAHAMASDRQLCLDADCMGYIAKPFNTRTLTAAHQPIAPA